MNQHLHLSVVNDGATYERRRHLAFKHIEGGSSWKDYRSAMRELCMVEAAKQRTEFGVKTTSSDLKACADSVSEYMVQHSWECMDVKPETKIRAVIRRWFDKVNGNSYFSARVTVECTDGRERSFLVPFQYGYGSQPEWQVLRDCINRGLIEPLKKSQSGTEIDAPWHLFDFSDQGFMKKSQRFGY